MIKEFLMKQLLQSKLKDLPKDMQDKIINAVSNNPDFFAKIATEAKTLVDSGKGEQEAMMEVVSKYKNELGTMMK